MWIWNLKYSVPAFFFDKKAGKKSRLTLGFFLFFKKRKRKNFGCREKSLSAGRQGEKPALGLKKNKSQLENISEQQ